jgi:hypothetical protein
MVKEHHPCWVPDSYSGGRDQEDHGSIPAWANSLQDPISKKSLTKNRAGGAAQDVGAEFKPKSKKKKKEKRMPSRIIQMYSQGQRRRRSS